MSKMRHRNAGSGHLGNKKARLLNSPLVHSAFIYSDHRLDSPVHAFARAEVQNGHIYGLP